MSWPTSSSGTDPSSAEIANIVEPPVMWLITSRTVHSLHGVGPPSWSGSISAMTLVVSSTTRWSKATWSICSPMFVRRRTVLAHTLS